MIITSTSNYKVINWAKLNIKKYRDEENLFLIEGDHLVNEALKKNLVKELITINDVYNFSNTYIVNDKIMNKITTQKSTPTVIAVCEKLKENISNGNMIILDNLQDPGNLGTIIRSAVAFGFENVCLGDGTVDIYNEKVIRASEGMIFNINVSKLNLETDLFELKSLGYKIIGTKLDSNNSITNFNNEKVAIVIGNEGSGINQNIECDDFITIPMTETCESLNAGVCASILMYEVYNG